MNGAVRPKLRPEDGEMPFFFRKNPTVQTPSPNKNWQVWGTFAILLL